MMELPENILDLIRDHTGLKTQPSQSADAQAATPKSGRGVTILRLSKGVLGKSATVQVREISNEDVGLMVTDAMLVGEEFVLMAPKATGAGIPIWCVVSQCNPGWSGDVAFIVDADFKQVYKPPTDLPDAARLQAAILEF